MSIIQNKGEKLKYFDVSFENLKKFNKKSSNTISIKKVFLKLFIKHRM